MSNEGFLQAGYEYIILDDCWQNPYRENYKLVADHVRFPSGISGLAEHVSHSLNSFRKMIIFSINFSTGTR